MLGAGLTLIGTLWLACSAQALNVVDQGSKRTAVSVGFLPGLGDLGSLGLGLDSNIVNAGIAAIALTAAAIIVLLLIPGIQLSYGGNALGESREARQFGLNGPGGVGLMTLFSVATDIYSKLDSDDVNCQKKIICEFMRDNNMFGTGANSVRNGIQYATSFLQNWGVPYITDIREAASLNDKSGTPCGELHPGCAHISLKESYDNSVKKVFKITEAKPDAANANTIPRKDNVNETEEEYEYEYYDRK